MNTSSSFRALRRANPRRRAGFQQLVEGAADGVQARIAAAPAHVRPAVPRRRVVSVSAGACLVAVAGVVAVLTVGAPGGGPGVESATAAVKRAATITAASAELSGTATVRIAHDGEVWAATTIRWHDGDLAVSQDTPQRTGKVGRALLVVDGIVYAPDPEVRDGWLSMESPDSIDPDSGTTPAEYLAAVREDVGGVTLRRIVEGVRDLTTSGRDDGGTVYRGTVAAGLIARETGFKEGQAIRVLPFGYVAHDEAADPAAPLETAVTVDADGIVREIALSWGTGSSAWTYTVAYRNLGTTPPLVAPANVRSLLEERRLGRRSSP
jgi:hypothetical protein